jgi:hypothetical protein
MLKKRLLFIGKYIPEIFILYIYFFFNDLARIHLFSFNTIYYNAWIKTTQSNRQSIVSVWWFSQCSVGCYKAGSRTKGKWMEINYYCRVSQVTFNHARTFLSISLSLWPTVLVHYCSVKTLHFYILLQIK